ncbi:MAG: hypothetical protein ACRC2V_15790 [Xenococcaceae cyanobacterium]
MKIDRELTGEVAIATSSATKLNVVLNHELSTNIFKATARSRK